jgi:uncharacterized membrane protein
MGGHMLDLEKKIVAVVSIGAMLMASSAVLFDRLLLAYAISIAYAIVRWKFCEYGEIQVSNNLTKWILRTFVVVCCIIFAAGGGAVGEMFKLKHELLPGAIAILGFAFAYDIGRYFKRISSA